MDEEREHVSPQQQYGFLGWGGYAPPPPQQHLLFHTRAALGILLPSGYTLPAVAAQNPRPGGSLPPAAAAAAAAVANVGAGVITPEAGGGHVIAILFV